MFKQPTLLVVCALLAWTNLQPTQLAAEDRSSQLTTLTAEEPVPKKIVRFPFRGTIHQVDIEAKTIELKGKTRNRIIHITDETKIMKQGKEATLEEAIAGEAVGGLLMRLADGTEQAVSLRLGPKTDS